jgi:hypothetical protein
MTQPLQIAVSDPFRARAGRLRAGALLLGLIMLGGCQEAVSPGTDLTQIPTAYAQLIGKNLPKDRASLQGYTRVSNGYHSYLRFRLDPGEIQAKLGRSGHPGPWHTESCSELQGRFSLPAEATDRFQPAWAPNFELSTRCYTQELSNHWGSADHILLIESNGLVYFHGVAR